MESITDAIQINENDNVATALRDLQPAEAVSVKSKNDTKQVVISDLIRYGHKFSLSEIEKDEHIIKYGEVIGIASKKIKKGAHVHIHNVLSLRGRGDLENKDRIG